jgi:ferredoxin
MPVPIIRPEVFMTTKSETLFEAFLEQYDDESWRDCIERLLPFIHEVDRAATRVWFYFFPLALARALTKAEDPDALRRELQLKGNYQLKDQIDSSHRFLYGHRYWAEVKKTVIEHATSTTAPRSLDLVAQIREVASRAAKKIDADESLLTSITAVAFMTLQQVGLAQFKSAPAPISQPSGRRSRTPEQVLRDRARDDGQGLFGFLRGEEKIYTVTFDEQDDSAKFKIIRSQHLTTAAANDKRDYHSRDARCMTGEGPIPIECRSAACGTCWVGVLGGAEKLSDVNALEGRRIKEFGYITTDEPKPLIRLACMAQAYGAISIVIPPWNGVFGRALREQDGEPEEARLP